MSQEQVVRRGIPEATVARLPVYLRALTALADRDITTVSSEELATAAGVNSAKLRKDLSHLGSYGVRGVGYDVEYLVYQISRELGLTQDWPVAIVGIGNLGHALAGYAGFATRGFEVVALFDTDPKIVGERGVVVVETDDAEALGDEAGVGRQRVAQVAHADDGHGPVLGQAEGPGDLEGERLDVVADAAHPVGAEVAEVLAELGRAHTDLGRELFGGDRQHAVLGQSGQRPQVLREPRDGCVGDLSTQNRVGGHACSPAPLAEAFWANAEHVRTCSG